MSQDCPMSRPIDGGISAVVCTLVPGHDGPHYDPWDDLYWYLPDEVPGAGARQSEHEPASHTR